MLALLLLTVGGVQAQEGNWSDYRDMSWGSDYDTATEFIITNPEQFAQFAFMVNSGNDFSGKTVTLDNGVEEIEWGGQVYPQTVWYDGNLQDYYWTPIGTADHPFNGTFNGNGKSITYVTINSTASYQGFFGYIGNSGKVQRLVFDYGSNISGSTQVGCLAGYNGGTVENCLVLNATVSGTGYVGSIIGQNAGTATNCYCIDCGTTFALGAEDSTTGVDSDGHAQCLYNIEGDESTISDTDFTTSVGLETGVEVGSGVFYTDGIQNNYYHYYKTGAKPTITYNKPGYNVTFSVSGTGASIDGNTITVGTGKVIVSLATKTVAQWSGAGTEADPYIIYNREQLDVLAQRVNQGSTYSGKFFKLNDYLRYNEGGHDYHVIGTSGFPFRGVFDGNGKTISYASSIAGEGNTYNNSLQGLFGYIGEGGVVKNLGASDCSFRGTNFIGVIAGDNEGTIENCRVDYYSSGNVVFTDNKSYYGTIAGRNSGIIRNCVSAGCVKADNGQNGSMVGGIVGHNTDKGTVENCLYVGSQLEGTIYVGAIAGHNEGTLTNNYYHDNGYLTSSNIGTTVLGVGVSGGLMGDDATGAAKAKVVILPEGGTGRQPYGATISGTPTYVTTSNPNAMPLSIYSNGLLFDDGYIDKKMDNAFYTTATTVELTATNVPFGYAATFSTESAGASFKGNTLTVGTDVTEVSVSAQRVATGWLAEGVRAASFSNTGTNSITIMSAKELGLLAYNVNFGGETYEGYTITIGVDEIDLAGHTWEPIGNVSGGMESGTISPTTGGGTVIGGGGTAYGGEASASGFLGTFDGAGHVITNLSVEGNYYVGLFSTVNSGVTVKDLFISGAVVKGNMYVGAIAGSVSGTIQNCHVSSSDIELVASSGNVNVSGSGRPSAGMLGGIAGMCQGGTIKGCAIFESSLYPQPAGSMGVGGITGYSTGSTLQDNLFGAGIAKKSSDDNFGAIIGIAQGGTISNNYYVDGGGLYDTPNTELKAVNGADTDGEAQRAYVYSSKPDGFGEVVTNYGLGMEGYSTGLHYGSSWYSPVAPLEKNIILNDTEDNSTILSNYKDISGVNVTLDRTFVKDGKWNTICLPFTINDINAEGCPLAGDDVELWQMIDSDTGFDEGTLTLNFENCYDEDNNITTLMAGYPYLIKWNGEGEKISNPVFEDVTITATSPKPETFGNNDEITFIGTFAKKTFETEDRSILFLGAQNMLYWPQPSGENIPNIGAFRAYFRLNGITAGDPVAPQSGNIRAFVLNFGDEATGISDMVNNKKASTSEWYSLDGRKLNSVGAGSVPTRFHKGIYINNGRKVVIK